MLNVGYEMKQEMRLKGLGAVVLVCVVLGGVVNEADAWPVPDNEVTTSYAVGDDGYYSINPRSYTGNGDGTVTDNVTQLVWQQSDSGQSHNWTDANAYCEDLTLGGLSDWRLPTLQELASIMDYGRVWPAFDSMAFDYSFMTYLTSTTLAINNSEAWSVSTTLGPFSHVSKSGLSGGVRCVRGASMSSSFMPLVINDSDTVTDVNTGLSWQRQDDEQTKSWGDALTYCAGLALDGFSDWRLPSINELTSLVNYDKLNPAIDQTVFFDTKQSPYWSSTTLAEMNYGGVTWYVNFQYGDVMFNYNNSLAAAYVRCVRSGPVKGALGALAILSPAMAKMAIVGTTLTIDWNPKGLTGQVIIALSRDGGKVGTWETISASTANDGTFEWLVAGPESANCVLKVEPIDAPDKVGYKGLFSIVTEGSTTTTSTSTTATSTTTTIPSADISDIAPLTSGWNLVGLGFKGTQPLEVSNLGPVNSVWKWTTVNGTKTWSVYVPGEATPGAYAASKGFGKLTTIVSGEGFWVDKP